MSRVSFFEAMQREINLNYEFQKIEQMIFVEEISLYGWTLYNEIEKNFRRWEHKDNYASFSELRISLGFEMYLTTKGGMDFTIEILDVPEFLLYCEMILNILSATILSRDKSTNDQVSNIKAVIKADITKLNHEILTTHDRKYLIIQCDAAASSVADLVDYDIAKTILQYNHYLLKGDIDEKRSLLKIIADDLEGKQVKLKDNKSLKDDLFYLFNNMNIRHNNSEPSSKNYNPIFSELTTRQIEDWYDEIYQLALYAYLTIDNKSRALKIKNWKHNTKDT